MCTKGFQFINGKVVDAITHDMLEQLPNGLVICPSCRLVYLPAMNEEGEIEMDELGVLKK